MSEGAGIRTAIVSGAASGIGLATARLLGEDGYAIVGVDLGEDPGGLAPAAGSSWVRGDVSASETWERALAAVLEHDPAGPSCLCLCAGDAIVAPFLETTIEQWTRTFEINVNGAVLAIQAALPAMIARGDGAIAVVCSVNSFFVEEGLGAYSASKAALLQVVRSAALEYASAGVRINAVCPGAVDTPLFRRATEALDAPTAAVEAVKRRTPNGRILAADEVAAAIRFLVGEGGSGFAGAALTVDGGLTTTYDFDSGPR